MYQPDIEAMTRHVDHLFAGAPSGLIELAWTDTTPDDAGRYRLRHARLFSVNALSELVTEAARLNATPMCNVYIGAALRYPDTAPFGRAKDDDASALTAAYVDLDDPGAATAAKSIYGALKPTMVVVTGREPHTRAQLWWRLDDPCTDRSQWPELLKGMSIAMGGDTSVTNPSRVMRLAGTVAWPVKPGRVIEQTFINPLKSPGQSRYSAAVLSAAFPAQNAPAAPVTPSAPKLAATLNAAKPATDRSTFFRQVNDLAMRNTSSWVPTVFGSAAKFQSGTGAWRISSKELGRHLEEDLSIAPTGIVDFGVHDMGDVRQGKRTPVDIVIEHGGASDAKSAAFWLCDQVGVKPKAMGWQEGKIPQELQEATKQDGDVSGDTPKGIPLESAFPITEADIPPRDWIIPGLLLKRHLSVLVAPPGSGKSLLTLQLAIATATGMSWGGWTVRAAKKVLVINAEDDIDEMRRRLVAATHVMSVNQKQLEGRLFLASAPENIVIAKSDSKTKTVVRTPLQEELIKTILDNDIGCSVVDPFAETFEGDENSNSEVKWAGVIWREVARRTGTSVLLVHHTKKYASGMAGDADASRGGGSLIGTARIMSTLFAMTEEEASTMNVPPEDRTRYVRFDDAKANLSLITGQAKWFEKKTVQLNNGNGLVPGDEVGVLAPWEPPGMLDGVSMFTIGQILDTIDRGLLDDTGVPTGQFYTAAASGPSKDRWAGTVIVRLLGCDEKRAKFLIKEWLKNEVLETYEYTDPVARKPRSATRSILNNRPDRAPQ